MVVLGHGVAVAQFTIWLITVNCGIPLTGIISCIDAVISCGYRVDGTVTGGETMAIWVL